MRTRVTTRFLTVVIAGLTLGTMTMATAEIVPIDEQIRTLILEFYEAASTSNIDVMADIVSQDPATTAIGTDPTEREHADVGDALHT